MMTNSDAQRLRALEKDDKEFKQMVAYLLLLKRWDGALFGPAICKFQAGITCFSSCALKSVG